MTGIARVHVHNQLEHEHLDNCILYAWHVQGQVDTDGGPVCIVVWVDVDLCAMLDAQHAVNQQVLSQECLICSVDNAGRVWAARSRKQSPDLPDTYQDDELRAGHQV